MTAQASIDWSGFPTPTWRRGDCWLYLGDCRHVLPRLPSASIDFVFTDPPYGHNNNNNNDLAHRREEALGLVRRGKANAGEARPIANDGPEANDLVRAAFIEINRLLKPGCCCCCCGGGGGPDPQFARWSLMLDEAIGFKHAVVWNKGGLGLGWHYRRNYELVLVAQKKGGPCRWFGGNNTSNIVEIPGIKPSATDHPTPKPVSLCRHFIALHAADRDLVLDPFLGGGATAVAALEMGHPFIGVELEERWFSMSIRRIDRAYDELALIDPTPPAERQRMLIEE